MEENNTYFGATMNELLDWLNELCDEAGFDREVGYNLLLELKKEEKALEEFVHFYKTGNCLCKHKIGDYTTADIMVWQMDHFRAHMDRLDNYNRYNRGSLVISTFITLIYGLRNPSDLIARISSETGTDLDSGWSIG